LRFGFWIISPVGVSNLIFLSSLSARPNFSTSLINLLVDLIAKGSDSIAQTILKLASEVR